MALNIRKIVIPYDFSETAALALEHGVFMARFYRAEIILIHVVESRSFTSSITSAFTKSDDDEVKVSVNQKLKEIADDIHHKSGIKVIYTTESGSIYKSIVNLARNEEADIIIMGTHGVSGFQEFFMGSNAYRVVSESPCPVVTVQAHAKRVGFKSIVLPIDDSPASRQKVPFVTDLAQKYNSVVHIAGLMTDKDELWMRKFKIKVEQVEEFLEKHDVSYTTTYISGDNLAKMTMEYATEINADLVTIMTEQEPNITGFFLGNYAQQVVNHCKVPVMSIRPAEIDPEKITVTF
jgi:nucleotide-binding universal stress UspA family protein